MTTTTTSPRRVQRRRTKGWTAPLDHLGRRPVYVGRGSPWGNPWTVTQDNHGRWIAMWNSAAGQPLPCGRHTFASAVDRQDAHAVAVRLYREYLDAHPELVERARAELAGRDLMCWCAEDMSCHADVLLRVANL